MVTTVSKVLMNRPDYNEPMIEICMKVSSIGGSFSIQNVYEIGTWYTIYTINWPNNDPK